MASSDAACPACGRYVGPVTVCPYCDIDIPQQRGYRILRLAAWLLASGGLFLLWMAAGQVAAPNWPVAKLTPSLQFAQLQFEGKLTHTPRVSRNRRSASTELDDGSGSTLRIVFLDDALEALLDLAHKPEPGTRFRVQGSPRIRQGQQPVLFLRDAGNFDILGSAS